MPAFRLLDTKGQPIGTIILNNSALEREIIEGNPDLGLGYTKRLDQQIVAFTLEIIPPRSERTKSALEKQIEEDMGRANIERWSSGSA